MNRKSFTLFESTVVLLISTLILGTAFTLTMINKKFYEFQKTKLLLAENLKIAQDLSFKKIELSNPTSTVCGVGILITKSGYIGIAYATATLDCYKIASNTPEEFNFTSKKPDLFFTKTLQIVRDENHPLLVREGFENIQIQYSTGTALNDFNSSSILFIHPYGDPLIYIDNNKIDFDREFKLIFKENNEHATITITTAGQIIAK